MAVAQLDSVSFKYVGTTIPALRDVTLDIREAETLALLGDAGAGKSTLLRILAGLEAPTSGQLYLNGQPVNGGASLREHVAMVFQNYALHANLNVEQNIAAYAPAGMGKEERRAATVELASVLGLDNVLNKSASKLNHTQRMLVALGRGILRRPALMLMDDPLAHLSPAYQAEVRAALKQALNHAGITAVYATSDPAEAAEMGDRVAVMHAGFVEQPTSPEMLTKSPPSLDLATSSEVEMNLIPTTVGPGSVIELGRMPLARVHAAPGDRVVVGIRESALVLTADGRGIACAVQAFQPARGGVRAEAALAGVEGRRPGVVRFRFPHGFTPRIGEEVYILPRDVDDVMVFDASTGSRIPLAH